MGSVAAIVVFYVACLGGCLALKSWELPRAGDLWSSIDRDLDTNWMVYKTSYNKTYAHMTEEITRRIYWEDALRFIADHNRKYERGESMFYLGENHLVDLAEDEYEAMYLSGLVLPEEEEVYPEALTQPDPEAALTLDWRDKHIVTEVKNQGSCGSCWAFSALGSMESIVKRKEQSANPDFSEQNLVDCADTRWGNYACRGGWMNNAYKYIVNSGGIDGEQCYPYRARRGGCSFKKSCIAAKATSYHTVGRSEHSLQSDVSRVGPVAIAADVSGRTFGYYRGGVWRNPSCNPQRPNHAMTNVGYGDASRGGRFWIIKNSWGKRWGDKGYIKMSKNNSNDCGIKSFASYPVV